ncbi:MAG: molybdopterin molybdotransferase MoeA [Bacteroidetes bacterium]|nr:molybdopterin molybdotransferase MoeA [Bacteroidota bacterium]
MISFDEAYKIIEKGFNEIKPETEKVLLERSLHRTLAEEVIADVDLPPFNNSAMDGIAVKYNENINEWKIVGEISAGNYEEFELNENSAVTIMTGSRIPEFCDTIIPVEDIDLNKDTASLKENAKIKKGVSIRKKGGDLTIGETAIPKNTFLKPRHLAAAATCGKSKLSVYKKLNIGVMATGDELIPVDEKPTGDKIRISNTYSLLAVIDELNMNAVDLGIVSDEKILLLQNIADALNSNIDILITTGGVSVGKFDYVKDVFEELGVEIKFWRASIKPGKPIVFGTFNKDGHSKLVFGLPGNPVSSLVNFEIFIRENIIKLYNQPKREYIEAVLQNNLKKTDKKRHFMRGVLSKTTNGTYEVSSEFSQSSGNLVEMSKANCLIVIEEETINPAKGKVVKCMMI